MVDKKRLLALTATLIGIDSQNPPGNEARIARFVKEYLARLGMKTRIYEFKRGRSNVVAVREGRRKTRSLLVTPHLDTVPAGTSWTLPPLKATSRRGRIFGLGATDCKGNLACGIEAIHSIVEEGRKLDYTLIFAATADEESGSALGLAPLLERGVLCADAALVLDSDDFNIVVAQKGLLHLRVVLQGKKAHGAYPWLGRNAIDQAVAILGELKAKNSRWRLKRQARLRPATINAGTIRGGDKVNVVADWCEFEIDCRFLPGTAAREVLKDITTTVRRHARSFRIEVEGIQDPYLIDERHPMVKGLAAAMRRCGVQPVIAGSEGATTISFFQRHGIVSVATGFGSGGCAHVADEYVRTDNLYRGARVLEEFLKDYKPFD